MANKKKLSSILKEGMEKMGYIEDLTDENLLYRKQEDGKYLTISFSSYRFENSKFMCDLYYSDSCIFALILSDFPGEAYARFTKFLTPKEKKTLNFDDLEFLNSSDMDKENTRNFLLLLDKAVKRFLVQPNLLERITASQELNEYMSLVNEVCSEWNKKYEPITIKDVPIMPNTKIQELKELTQISINYLRKINYIYQSKEMAQMIALDVYRHSLHKEINS